ncbi:hypothetical protein F2Q69_00017902 [Brassica cretica]|uniref:Uncharacterized protein n=1 Tax=Brassica cretica TaxID=69181 RepID=A0A8S9QK30_BRACR|nr:hypothetical protein F2Q69_00017902 [Brassica cretica]
MERHLHSKIGGKALFKEEANGDGDEPTGPERTATQDNKTAIDMERHLHSKIGGKALLKEEANGDGDEPDESTGLKLKSDELIKPTSKLFWPNSARMTTLRVASPVFTLVYILKTGRINWVPRSLAASLKPLPLPLSPSLSLSQIFSLIFSVSEASSCWDVEKMTTEHESSQLYAIQTVLFLSGFGSLCFFST